MMAQHESQTEYNMLRLPVSAHSAALGGDNITLVEDDPALIFDNPALLSNVANKTIGLNYMNYMAGINTLSATYDFSVLERGTVAVSAQYIAYGSMKETAVDGTITGDFNAKDISFAGYFSYLLNDYFSAGIALKFITSYIAEYNSLAVATDLGINYFNPDNEWSASIVVKNLGGQVKAYNEDYEPLPIDVQAGVSKRLIHTPLRLNLTFVDLNHLNYKFINHVVFGADLLLPYNIWIGGGYNFRRADEMKIGAADEKSSHGAGLSFGGGIGLDRFGVNFSWGKYHLAGSSLIVNVNYKL
ncbi:MAG: type IX secretion system protein PorQ [Prevotella sp.]|nr:type IX secretion system protein PorQ [Prevotella sp.]MCD8305508.1 type IX secretion system protein PorQ [Prevotella sp.]